VQDSFKRKALKGIVSWGKEKENITEKPCFKKREKKKIWSISQTRSESQRKNGALESSSGHKKWLSSAHGEKSDNANRRDPAP